MSLPRAYTASLALVATSHSLRCDAKNANPEFLAALRSVQAAGAFSIGDFLPRPFVKGKQPSYLDFPTEDSVPVVNTASVRGLSIHVEDCRHIDMGAYDALDDARQLRPGDVVLTVDGGVSIGKVARVDMEGPATVDSHVVILRPVGLAPLALVYLLASPLGQLQFRAAETGSSGQTGVTEDDVRRFVFPRGVLDGIDLAVQRMEQARTNIEARRAALDQEEEQLWEALGELVSS